MNIEVLKTELARAEEAAMQSDDQLRALPDLFAKICAPDSHLSPSDYSRSVSSLLTLNERLHQRVKELRSELRKAEMEARTSGQRAAQAQRT